MAKKEKTKKLLSISPDVILPNPENPRLIFRPEEMETLLVSISKHGIQVPIVVYEHRNKYYLIDGERRWKCAKKLNLRSIPALVQEKPTELENLLLMSNIHALREQWDYLTIAANLERIILLFEKERSHKPNEIELSQETGLTRGQIRRCNLLLGIPNKFKEMLLDELKQPKAKQRLSEDLFIEMEKSLKTVTNRLPEYVDRLDSIRDVLVEKAKSGVISAVTDFRQLSKIATAVDNLGIQRKKAIKAIDKIFSPNKVNIRDTFKETVEFEYDEKRALQQLNLLSDYFDEIIEDDLYDQLDEELLDKARELYGRLKIILEG